MIFIDFHAHVYPEKIAKKATESVCDFYSLTTPYIGTVQEKIDLDKSLGIEKSLLLPVAVTPQTVARINEFSLDTAKAHSHFIPFATVHAEDKDLMEKAQYYKQQGYYGIKMHPDMQLFHIDDERLFPLYDFMQDKLPVMFHAGDPRHPYSHPQKIRRIMDMFPRLIVIAAHLGGWSTQDLGVKYLSEKENCFVDTSSSLDSLPQEKAVAYINAYGTSRVLFGTDFPVDDPVVQQKMFLNLPFSEDTKEQMAYHNAKRLLNL